MRKYRVYKSLSIPGRWYAEEVVDDCVTLGRWFRTWQEAMDWVDEQIQTTPMEVCS